MVDIIEPITKFTDVLQGKPGVGNIFNVGLEGWKPEDGVKYDLIWTQWCVGHLPDDLLVEYFERCKSALAQDGVMVIKENLSTNGVDVFDDLDSSVTRYVYDPVMDEILTRNREDEKFLALFKQAGLQVVRSDIQRGFPMVGNTALMPVKMYALKPAEG